MISKEKNNYNFWQNEDLFLQNIKDIKFEQQTYIIGYNNLKEEKKAETNLNYILTTSNKKFKIANLLKVQQTSLALYDRILDEYFIKNNKIYNENQQNLFINSNYHYKKANAKYTNIRKLFKLLHISKLLPKFKRKQQLLQYHSLTNYLINFKISKNLIDQFLMQFLEVAIKKQLKKKNLKIYGIVLAIIPFKGAVISIGHLKFFMPISKLTDRQHTKILHAEQCKILINYLSNNILNFQLLKPYEKKRTNNKLIIITQK